MSLLPLFNEWEDDGFEVFAGDDAVVEMDGVVEAAAVMGNIVAFGKLGLKSLAVRLFVNKMDSFDSDDTIDQTPCLHPFFSGWWRYALHAFYKCIEKEIVGHYAVLDD